MNTYPGFYKAVDGKEYLYLDKSNYFSFERGIWDKSDSADNHDDDANITREYLANTKVEIESEEHSFFIQELAFKYGYIWIDGSSKNIELSGGYIVFNRGSMLISHTANPSYSVYKKITIPLPPKEPEPKDWPQVGDEVVYTSNEPPKHHEDCNLDEHCIVDTWKSGDELSVIAIASIHGKSMPVVQNKRTQEVSSIMAELIKKPLTPEEELREKLKEELSSYISRHDPYDTLIDLTDGILNGEIEGLSYKPE